MKIAPASHQEISTMKLHLVEQILAEQNTDMLKAFGDFLDKNRIVAHTVGGRPLTREEYLAEIEIGREQARQGIGFTTEEVKAKMAVWGKRS